MCLIKALYWQLVTWQNFAPYLPHVLIHENILTTNFIYRNVSIVLTFEICHKNLYKNLSIVLILQKYPIKPKQVAQLSNFPLEGSTVRQHRWTTSRPSLNPPQNRILCWLVFFIIKISIITRLSSILKICGNLVCIIFQFYCQGYWHHTGHKPRIAVEGKFLQPIASFPWSPLKHSCMAEHAFFFPSDIGKRRQSCPHPPIHIRLLRSTSI